MIIFDENVEDYWIQLIQSKGYQTLSIRENFPGISDKEVIEIVKQHKGLLVTEDKDFGEYVYSYGINELAILFMRYNQPQYELIEKQVLRSIEEYYKNPVHCFITITKNKIRLRKL